MAFVKNRFPKIKPRAAVIDWTSPHEKTGEQPMPEEALLLTAEEVPIELTAEVHYRIADLHQFAFGNANPRRIAAGGDRADAANSGGEDFAR